MTGKSKERRSHPRVQASLALQVSNQGDALVAAAQNLSRSGIMCTLPISIKSMTQVNISINVPPIGTGPRDVGHDIHTEGVVVRSEPIQKGLYETAIFFPDLSEDDAIFIDRFVKGRSDKRI